MINWEFLMDLAKRFAEIGKMERKIPPISEVEPFRHYFKKDGNWENKVDKERVKKFLSVIDQCEIEK